MFELRDVENAVVIGAGHGIGLALCSAIASRVPEANVFATYRRKEKAGSLLSLAEDFPGVRAKQLDPRKEEEVEAFFETIASERIDLLVNCVGFLHDDEVQPEKKLGDISTATLEKYFSVNSIPTMILAKHSKSFFKNKTPGVWASVSAKVGSIEDNAIGGWYGYRASKAAMNMFLKTMAIEMQRYHCNTSVMALHPGTTVTELSEPFIGRTKYKLHSPDETAANLLDVIEQRSGESSGFWSWDGQKIPW